MRRMRAWLIRLGGLFSKEGRDRELAAELESHLQMHIEHNVRAGMTPEEARRRALIQLGGVEQTKENYRDRRGIPWLETLLQDIRFGLRILRKNPGFTAVVILTLALGIGANAAVFSVVNSVLLKPLPYPQSERLVALRQAAPGASGLASFIDGLLLSPSMYFTYAEHNQTFQSVGIWTPGAASVTGLGQPEQVRVMGVSDGLLQTLGVPPARGRWLSSVDQDPHSPKTVLLSYGYWQRRFGGDPAIVGKSIVMDSVPREIVGTMPKGFRLVGMDFDAIVPFAFDRSKLSLPGFGFNGIGRLRPGVTLARADADLTRLLPVWENSWPYPGNPHIYDSWEITPQIWSLKDEILGNVGSVLWIVMATIGIALLVACANVANLLLVRTEARQQEIAIRAALGAGRARIVRGLLVESTLLGVAGGILGLAFAKVGLRLLLAVGPARLPRLNEVALDARALAFAAVVSLLSVLLFGLIPALKYSRADRNLPTVRSGSRTSTLSRQRHRAHNLLVVGQMAMALLLMTSAGLMIRTFRALRAVDPGFNHARDLQTVRISIPQQLIPKPEQVTRTENDILDRLAAIPGSHSAAFANSLPLDRYGESWDAILPEGRTYPAGEIPPLRIFKFVSPDLFRTMGTRLVAGRDLTWTDVYGQRRFTLVSESLARELWGTAADALHKRFNEGPGAPWWEVIGVVQDVRENGVDQKAPATVYFPPLTDNIVGPGALNAVRQATFVVRNERAGTTDFLEQVQQSVWSVNSNLPLANVRTMQDVYDQSMARTSLTLVMLAIAGAMALALGIIGIYGVVSYLVTQRTHEIGIRMALGAQSGDILREVLRDGGTMAAFGIALGLAASFGLTRFMATMLFGVSATDPLTFAVVALVLLTVALGACWIPARRAMRVDPMVALRYE
jgi:putative ABC transport system permease protein